MDGGETRRLIIFVSRHLNETFVEFSGDAFADFLKRETARVTDVLKSVGLVKS